MKRSFAAHGSSNRMSRQLVGPAALIGSLFVIALILYAIDIAPLRMLLAMP